MVEILALVLHHDEQAVLVAVELALEDGVPSKTHILNRLHRLVDGKPATPPVVTAPQALALTNEPRADVERYDALAPDRGDAPCVMILRQRRSRHPAAQLEDVWHGAGRR